MTLMHCDVCGDSPKSAGEWKVRCSGCGQFGERDLWNQMIIHSLRMQERELFLRLAALTWTELGMPKLQEIREVIEERYAYLGERAKEFLI